MLLLYEAGKIMAADDRERREAHVAFAALAERYTCNGWIEYLLWETFEGKRERPFLFLPPLSDEDARVLVRLWALDEWLWWDEGAGLWRPVPLNDWQAHAEVRTADDVRSEMDRAVTR